MTSDYDKKYDSDIDLEQEEQDKYYEQHLDDDYENYYEDLPLDEDKVEFVEPDDDYDYSFYFDKLSD